MMRRGYLLIVLGAAWIAGCSSQVAPEAAVGEARQLLAQGKSGEARIVLKNALAQSTQLEGARALLAQMALDDGNPGAAAAELSAVKDSTDPEVLALQVRVALAQGQVSQADELLTRTGDRMPAIERSLLRAAVLSAAGSGAEALALLRGTQREQPESERIAVEIASLLADGGNLEPAIETLDRHLASASKDRADALRTRAMLRLRQGSPELAGQDLELALKNAPAAWPLTRRLTTRLLQLEAKLAAGRYAEVRSGLTAINKERPGMQGATVISARLSLLEDRPGEAVDKLTPVVEASPGNDWLETLMIDALIRSGSRVRAQEMLERRVAEDPLDLSARWTLASLMTEQGRPDRVVELLGEVEGQALLDTQGLGELLEMARQTQSAANADVNRLTTALSGSGATPDVRLKLAQAQLAAGDAAAALESIDALPPGKASAAAVATRLAALLVAERKTDSTRLVDQLLNPASRTDIETLLAAADAAYRYRQLAMASQLLDQAMRLQPKDPRVALRRASVAFDERRHADARALLEPLAATGKSVEVQVALARVQEASGDADAARAVLGKAMQASPSEMDLPLTLAGLELRANRSAEARKVLDTLIARDVDGEAAHAAGMLAVGANDFEDARMRFRQAVERDPKNGDFWFSLGQAQLAVSDRPAAKESFQKAVALQPGSPTAVAAAVRLSLDQQDGAAAAGASSRYLAAAPADPLAWELEGEVALFRRDASRARQAFEKSYSLKPAASVAIGEFRARMQQSEDTAHLPLAKWLSVDPQDEVVRAMLAEHHLSRGESAAAQAQLEIMVKQLPNDVVALNNLAWLLKDKDAVRAEQLARRAVAIAPDNAAVADTLGLVLLAQNRSAEAVDILKMVAAAQPEDRAINFHYARALHSAGQDGKALAILDVVLRGNVPFEGREVAQRLAEELKK